MTGAATSFVEAVNWTVLGYVILLDASMLLLVLFGARRVLDNRR